MGARSASGLRVAPHFVVKEASTLLGEALAEASSSGAGGSAACDMCAEALVEKVLLQQQNDSSGAQAALDKHRGKLSKGVREARAPLICMRQCAYGYGR